MVSHFSNNEIERNGFYFIFNNSSHKIMLVFAIEATKTGYMRSNIGFVDGRRSWFISYFKKRIASNLVYLSFVSGVF